MTPTDVEQIARLLAALPPAPDGWAASATDLPAIRVSLDGLIAQAERDARLRARLLADLEFALAESGIEPSERVVREAKRRLGAP